MLAGGEEDDPAVGTLVVVASGERLGEQDGGAGVDRPGAVELRGAYRRERLVGAVGVVDDETVDRPEGVERRLDHPARRVGLAEIRLEEPEALRRPARLGGARVSLARLGDAQVSGPQRGGSVLPLLTERVAEHLRTVAQQAPRDREADPRRPSHAGDDHDPLP